MKKVFLISLFSFGCLVFGGETNKPVNLSPCSFPYITHLTGDRNGISIGFQTNPGCKYQVQNTVDFKTWNVLTNFTATGYSFSMVVSSDHYLYNKKQFVRLKIGCSCRIDK